MCPMKLRFSYERMIDHVIFHVFFKYIKKSEKLHFICTPFSLGEKHFFVPQDCEMCSFICNISTFMHA